MDSMLDMREAYERVTHRGLVAAARREGVPLRRLKLLLRCVRRCPSPVLGSLEDVRVFGVAFSGGRVFLRNVTVAVMLIRSMTPCWLAGRPLGHTWLSMTSEPLFTATPVGGERSRRGAS